MELHSKIVHLEEKISKMEELSGALVNKQCEVMKLYKEITEAGCLLGGMLTLSERNAIKDEVKKAKQLTNFGFRKEDIDLVELFDPNLFNQLLHNMKRDCPTILNILEQLVISPNASRNIKKTVSLKMKAAVHLLGSLLDVRDQNSGNDIPVLFGLLCLCYGAGPSMIEVLQSLGLSESFTTLTSLLKRQLQRYREIIAKRVPDNIPVITYQDNMQLMRTSMRHLRLSKLHKEKQKQNKMWDFTVRGWRKADISGIENLFKHKETAVDPQKDIRSLEYSEIKIESNQEHLELWNAFKEKKTLQKLDKVLNHIKSTSEELIHATSEELEKMAKQAEESKSHVKNFKIEIPDVYEEFPSLGKKQSKIYPLPISHENQCTILGVASNLDLFASEFGFKARRTDERPYLPLKRSGKDYDLDKAYQRYAFLKSYEKHQEKQKEYDSILRGQERVLEDTEMHETEIEETIIFHDDDCSSSDDDRED
ncbi:hypothetical protein QZH41_011439 [Actinostola sp. cb2023]|nr:hypothetical protein QZH41_011439 [Actinostola sp. cb2023]